MPSSPVGSQALFVKKQEIAQVTVHEQCNASVLINGLDYQRVVSLFLPHEGAEKWPLQMEERKKKRDQGIFSK